ncbi:MoaD/ThiS family protein [Georgenia sp. Z1491]|uniref:MoaD/ThiS family protein n=1 Tax=Georgenia sp. Z1491 TaxID=3416707 RepID=UPI003CEE5BA8
MTTEATPTTTTTTPGPTAAGTSTTAGTTTVTVRFFAGAAEAAGTGVRTVEVPAGATVGTVVAALREDADERLTKVLDVATWLLDGRRTQDSAPVPAGATVDCLPPFAGG